MNTDRLKKLIIHVKELSEKLDDDNAHECAMDILVEIGDRYPICVFEEIVKMKSDELRYITRKEIPDMMNEEGIQSLTLDDGMKLELITGINPEIVDSEKCMEWIEEIGNGDSIKSTLEFGKGEVDENLRSYLEENGYSYTKKDGIHYQTLKKIVSDRYKNGDGLPPLDAIVVETYSEVKIK